MGVLPPHVALDAILAEENHASPDDDSVERIGALIEDEGWDVVRTCLLAILEDPARPPAHWQTVAEVVWGAVLDARPLPDDRVIALLYARLPHDVDSAENNLVWSITSKLRGVSYLSDYNPLADPRIIAELATIRR